MTYSAEPICDELPEPLALDLHVVTFHAGYYKTQLGSCNNCSSTCCSFTFDSGRKKIDQVENEIRRLTRLPDYSHVHRVLSVQSNNSKPTQTPRLTILMEKKPAFTLQDLLQDCDGLREDRTKVGFSHEGLDFYAKIPFEVIFDTDP